MAATCDILIVGGGVTGASLAFHLARRQAGRVVLLERAFPGAGASGRAGGIVRGHDSHSPTAALAKQSLRFYEQFAEHVGGPAVFARTGMVLVAPQEQREALAALHVHLLAEHGVEVRPLSAPELMDLDPNAHLAEDEVAVLEREAGHVDAVLAVASFVEAARRHGADVRLGVDAQEVRLDKGKVVGAATNEGDYACAHLILAAGAWAPSLLPDRKSGPPLSPVRAQTALFRRPPDCARRGVIVADLVHGLYFRPATGDLLLAGSLLADERRPADAADLSEAADADWLPKARQRLCRRCPALHRAYGRGGFSAVLATTPDARPVLGRVPGAEGLFVASGLGGHDVRLAPAVGQLLADLVLGGPPGPLVPFRPTRFEEGDVAPPGLPSDAMS
jgi:glycine/D-amino acid oxidase-like deaminating enzyme